MKRGREGWRKWKGGRMRGREDGWREGGRERRRKGKTAECYKLSTTQLTQCFPILFALLNGSSMAPAQEERSSLHRDGRPLAPQRQQDNKLSISLLCLLTWRGCYMSVGGGQTAAVAQLSGAKKEIQRAKTYTQVLPY